MSDVKKDLILSNAELALIELMYRNPQRHDGNAYDLNLAAWGIGVKKQKPAPNDFGQPDYDQNDMKDFAYGLAEIYEEEE